MSEKLLNGYRVEPAANGGWIIRDIVESGYMLDVWAFSSAEDLLKFLSELHFPLQTSEQPPESPTDSEPDSGDPMVGSGEVDTINKRWEACDALGDEINPMAEQAKEAMRHWSAAPNGSTQE